MHDGSAVHELWRERPTGEPVFAWSTDVLRRHAAAAGDGTVMMSLVFAHPDSVVFRDLRRRFSYYHVRSGPSWGLFFAGYTAEPWPVGHRSFLPGTKRPSLGYANPGRWGFSADEFNSMRVFVEQSHRESLERPAARNGHQPHPTPWRYSGNCDLVSIMAYQTDDPSGFVMDYPSLKSITLTDGNDNYIGPSLSETIEVMSNWREEIPGISYFAAGQPPEVVSTESLLVPLKVVAEAMLLGIAGNACYDLIKSVVS